MVARGRALVREWGASVQCREVGEEVWCAWGDPRLVIEEGRTEAGCCIPCWGGATEPREREGSGRAVPVRAGSEGGEADLV